MSLGESLKSYRSSFREKISSLLWFCKHTTEHLVAGERSPKNKNFDCRLTGQGIRDTCLLAGLPACLLARCGRHSGQLSGRRFCVSLRVCLHVCLRAAGGIAGSSAGGASASACGFACMFACARPTTVHWPRFSTFKSHVCIKVVVSSQPGAPQDTTHKTHKKRNRAGCGT